MSIGGCGCGSISTGELRPFNDSSPTVAVLEPTKNDDYSRIPGYNAVRNNSEGLVLESIRLVSPASCVSRLSPESISLFPVHTSYPPDRLRYDVRVPSPLLS